MSGYLDINKTYHKIYNHFYWSGLNSDVSKYCKTCHAHQIEGKPNQTISKAQLQPIPALEKPSVGYLYTVLVLYLKPCQGMSIS